MASALRSSAEGRPRVFADTSFFFALLHPQDQHHGEATEIAEEVARERLTVYTTWEVAVETVTLLRYRANFETARMFLLDVAPDLVLVHPLEAERQAAIQIFLRRSHDLKLSLCDAISYVIVSTRLSWAACLSFDADFAALGLTVVRR
jgi:predicted nucleic acid-binding protein